MKKTNKKANGTSKKKKQRKKKKNISLKGFFTSILFLKIVFIFLLVLVVALSVAVYHKNQMEKKRVKANIVIPIKDFNANYSFGVNLKSLVGKKYLFKVTNYRNGETNSQDVYYSIIINNNTGSQISISRDGNKKLIEPGISSNSDSIMLPKNEKVTDYYYLEVEQATDVQDDEKIQITVISRDNDSEE